MNNRQGCPSQIALTLPQIATASRQHRRDEGEITDHGHVLTHVGQKEDDDADRDQAGRHRTDAHVLFGFDLLANLLGPRPKLLVRLGFFLAACTGLLCHLGESTRARIKTIQEGAGLLHLRFVVNPNCNRTVPSLLEGGEHAVCIERIAEGFRLGLVRYGRQHTHCGRSVVASICGSIATNQGVHEAVSGKLRAVGMHAVLPKPAFVPHSDLL